MRNISLVGGGVKLQSRGAELLTSSKGMDKFVKIV